MCTYGRQSTASRKKLGQLPRQELVQLHHTVSCGRDVADPLDKVRTQAYRNSLHAAYFAIEKVSQAEEFVQELDEELTGGQIGDLTAHTGGIKIPWNKRFTATAGVAKCKRGSYPSATIELSDKLIDN
jgi:hypothetical protein